MTPIKMPKQCISKKILENISTAIVVVGDDLSIVELNSAAEVLLSTSIRKAYKSKLLDLVKFSTKVTEQITKVLVFGSSFTNRKVSLSIIGKGTHTVDLCVT